MTDKNTALLRMFDDPFAESAGDRTLSLSIRYADDGNRYGVRELSPEMLVMKCLSPFYGRRA